MMMTTTTMAGIIVKSYVIMSKVVLLIVCALIAIKHRLISKCFLIPVHGSHKRLQLLIEFISAIKKKEILVYWHIKIL